MRPSQYNYIVDNGDKTIFYNGLTEAFFEVKDERADIYKEILQNPSLYAETFSSFLERMKEKGFIVGVDTDEEGLLEKKFQAVFSEDLYHIMILPTYQCNLRCWYCVQDHKELWMSDDTVSRIKELLKRNIQDENIKRVRLSWFGGEPLMGYDTILDVTAFTKGLADEYGKTFTSDITTNATLLNRARIVALREAGVTDYQITIDGDKKLHDSIKVLPEGSAYEKSIENINIITETTHCNLRFNYTHENLKPEAIIEDLRSHIKAENRPNITFLIYKVWQESQSDIDDNEVSKMVRLSNDMGMRTNLPTCNMCYSDCANFNCIFPNGTVEKCDNESPTATRGEIVDGKIEWKGDISSHTPAYKNPSFPCKKCKYVPICWGPCVAKRDIMLKNHGKGKCQYSDKNIEVAKLIINRCTNGKTMKQTV